MIDSIINKYKNFFPITIIRGFTYESLKSAELAFVASGTATLEAAVIGTPMVILYKLSWPTYLIAKTLIKLPAIGLVNIVAGEKIAPELIQTNATGQNLADAADRVLTDPEYRKSIIHGMFRVRKILGKPGATSRAANAVVDFLMKSKGSSIEVLNQ
jgi:lipid-A-disaccharide synthase